MPSLTINGKSLFYCDDEQAGEAEKKVITLFLHGLGSSSCVYKTITPYLQRLTRCIALDAPGSGLSLMGVSEQGVNTIADDALALLDALKIEDRVIVVGHSMGCIVASYIAATYPGRVKGVVLMGPVNPSPALTEVFEQRIKVIQKDGIEYFANTIPQSATGPGSGPLQHAFIRSLISGTSPKGYISLCQVIARAKPPKYDLIKAPLLILVGSGDKTAPQEISEAIFKDYGTDSSKKAIEVLSGIGHWYSVEDHELIQRLVGNFITQYG